MPSRDIKSMGFIAKEQYIEHCLTCGCLVSSEPTESFTSDSTHETVFKVYCSCSFCKYLIEKLRIEMFEKTGC